MNEISEIEAQELVNMNKTDYIKFPCGLQILSRKLNVSLGDLPKIKCPLHGNKCYNRKELADISGFYKDEIKEVKKKK